MLAARPTGFPRFSPSLDSFVAFCLTGLNWKTRQVNLTEARSRSMCFALYAPLPWQVD